MGPRVRFDSRLLRGLLLRKDERTRGDQPGDKRACLPYGDGLADAAELAGGRQLTPKALNPTGGPGLGFRV